MMHRVFRIFVSPRRAGALLALAAGLALLPLAGFAAQGLVVTPLEDDFGGGQSPDAPGAVQPGPAESAGPAGAGGEGPTASEPGMAPGSDGAMLPVIPDQPSYKDGIVMAYLVELMRKQDKACPSGAKPPVPPSLLFSEPLCRVAEAVANGAGFPEAYAEQGIYATRWRMFSAGDMPPQRIATRLRAEHCEALLEPHTHIGAWKGPQGWRILLATLAEKPPAGPDGAPAAEPSPTPPEPAAAPTAPVAPLPQAPQAAGNGAMPAPAATPGAASGTPAAASGTPAAPAATVPGPAVGREASKAVAATAAAPAPDARVAGREARALFQVLNDIRAKGGSCLGKPARTAPPLAFDPILQAAAEKDASEAAARGNFGLALGGAGDQGGIAKDYPGARVVKLTASSGSPPSVVADIWMVNPSRCDAIVSSDIRDAGVAFVDGYWIVLLGQPAKGVPSPEIPASRQKAGSTGR